MRAVYGCLIAILAATAVAQQRPVFDPDDFVDPALHESPMLISRLVSGVARNLIDDYRPLDDDAAFLYLANSFYWSRFQVDYKTSAVRARNDSAQVFACGCSPELFFPTPPLPDETPAPPPPGMRHTLQFGWYYALPRANRDPVMLRLRMTLSYQSTSIRR